MSQTDPSATMEKSVTASETAAARRRIPARYLVLTLIFVITAVNYADRSSLSITGSSI